MLSALRTYFFAFFLIVANLAAGPAHASLTAGDAFGSLMGTTTIDQGGAIHSQARSIYSLGGGQISVQGKRLTLLAVDPPSFSAGCGGISWHFGGFAFISMDEIRQMVEAISQAALGVAVDLAMQTLCPQCYAVMSKLREIANAMRNAAADSCRVAYAIGRSIASSLGGPEPGQASKASCSSLTSESGQSDSFLGAAAGAVCGGLNKINDVLTQYGDKFQNWLNGDRSGSTPNADFQSLHFNAQYEMLTVLGYKDGFIKDVMLNITGMAIHFPTPAKDCTRAFANIRAENFPTGAGERSPNEVEKPSDGNPSPAKPEASGDDRGKQTCYAPPTIPGLGKIARAMVCGWQPQADFARFVAATGVNPDEFKRTSLGTMCGLSKSGMPEEPVAADTMMYTCREGSKRCLQPGWDRYSKLVASPGAKEDALGYTGIGWAIADALYRGINRVQQNKPLDPETIAFLNGSEYPLYRLINLAAVYPGSARGYLGAYIATIAIEQTTRTIDALTRPGSLSTLELQGTKAALRSSEIAQLKEELYQIGRSGAAVKEEALKFLSEKQGMVQSIVELNRALQSEVFSTSVMGGANLAVSLKHQLELNGKGDK